MRVVHPSIYLKQQERKRKNRKIKFLLPVVLIVFSCFGYGYLAINVKPTYQVSRTYPNELKGEDVAVPWPSEGSGAIGYLGSKTEVLNSFNGNTKVPTASTIKVLTALVVLEQKPLGPKESGERVYFNNSDVEMTNRISQLGGVVFPITNGMSMSYHQALELTLVGSANNIAEKLAVWAYGGVNEYNQAAIKYAKSIGANNTIVTDPSGLLSSTTSTADDLLKISLQAMQRPVIKEISKLKRTNVNGITIESTNKLLEASGGIDGLKTGYTPEAGNCLILTKTIQLFSEEYVFVVVLLGQPSRDTVFSNTKQLLDEFLAQTTDQVIVKAYTHVADIKAPWGEETRVVNKSDLDGYRWSGETVSAEITIDGTGYATRGTKVGKVVYRDRQVDAVLESNLPKAPLMWRLTHAFDHLGEIL